jgi:hypothetical protein
MYPQGFITRNAQFSYETLIPSFNSREGFVSLVLSLGYACSVKPFFLTVDVVVSMIAFLNPHGPCCMYRTKWLTTPTPV